MHYVVVKTYVSSIFHLQQPNSQALTLSSREVYITYHRARVLFFKKSYIRSVKRAVTGKMVQRFFKVDQIRR